MSIYTRIIKPIFFLQDPEKVHDRAVKLGKFMGSNPLTRKVVSVMFEYQNPMLSQTIADIRFRNPVGLAAGFDKDCNLMDILPSVGFGFEEVGSISIDPYGGNPKPRVVRLPKDDSIIVYYGLKTKGAQILRKRLERDFAIPVGVSIVKTNKKFKDTKEKLDDWIRGIKALKDVGHYVTINVSCPNTYDPMNFCDPKLLESLLKRIKKENITFSKPVFLKLTADLKLSQVDEIISVCDQHDFIKGFVLTNLVKDRSSITLKSSKEEYEPYKGGLSGKVVKPKALELTKHFYKQAGDRYILIGCGGIFDAEDAYEYIKNGASLVQLITGMIFGGPGTIKKINKGLVKLLEEDGYENISQAIGSALR